MKVTKLNNFNICLIKFTFDFCPYCAITVEKHFCFFLMLKSKNK